MRKEVKIGIFAIVMICCAWAGVKFFNGIDIFSRNVEYKAMYEQIGGVQSASAVMIRGVKVGTVTAINFDPSVDKNVYLGLTVQRKYKIPVDSKAKITSNGLMGGKIINITLGESKEYLENGDYIQTQEETDLFAMAGTEFDALKGKLNELSGDMSRLMGNLNSLMESNNTYINGLLSNLEGVSKNLNSLLSGSKGDLGRMIGGMSDFAETLGENSQRMDSIMLNLNNISTQLSDANVGESLSETVAGLNKTLSALNSKEGSMGLLMNDEVLYNNLAAATSSLDSLLTDLKDHPKRYVHFSLFGRKDK